MKRLIALSMVVVALPLMAKTWYDENTGYTWTYRINGDMAEIVNFNDFYYSAAISPSPTGAVTIPSTLGGKPVTSIGYRAFYNCIGLTSLTIPGSVASIGEGAFEGCSASLYDTATIPGVRLVDGWAVGYTDSLSGNLNLTGIRGIGNSAFACCSGLTSVTIPKSVINIGYEAFALCNLEEITLPFVGSQRGNSGSADSLFGYIFFHYQGYTRRYYSDDSYIECSIPSSLKKVIVTDETVLGYGAFYKCRELTSITISDSVTNIETKAFYGCSGLTSVTIGNSVTSIGDDAFRGCSGLTSVTIPNSVTDIGMGAFCGCSGLVQIILPFVGARRGNSGRSDSLFGYIFYGGELGLFGVQRGPGWSPDPGYYTPYIPSGLRSVVITDETVIGCKAFYRCSGLRNLTIPDSVTSIGDEAFYDCNGLMRLTIPDSVTSIGAESFSRCSGLGSVTIPDSVTSIGDGAFWSCSGLASVTIPQCVCDSRLSTVFRSCDSIKNVIISEGVTSVADYAFYNCSGLTSVTIPDSVVNIGDNAFKGCNGLSKVTIPNVVCASTISTVFPSAYQSIREVVLPDSATGLGEGLFSGCRMLSSVIIPKDVVSIGDFAFSDCSKLEGVEIPYGVKNFGAHAFAGCVALEDVTIPYSIKQLGDYAFSGCSSLHRIVLPGWLRGTFDESTFSGNADDFEIVYIDGVGICVNASDMGFSEGEHCLWYGDRDVSHDGIASARLKGMGQDSESSIELHLDSPGRLSFWWKASSESDGNNVFDYAYLSIDGVPQGTLNKESYSLNGVAIGGKTGWRHKVIDVVGKGSHVIRWTYAKDEIDEGDTGDDCVWLDEVEFTPLAYLSFDIAGGTGMVPAEISELEGTVVTLPAQSGFEWEDHVFNGWSDGKATYAAESQYVVPASSVTFTAQWIAKRFLTFALDGGQGQIPVTIKNVPGADITLPSANGISRTKHVFMGWSDGATTYDAGANYRVTDASVEFKAVWQRKEAHVSIVSDDVVNGGTVDTQGATISMSACSNPSVGTPAIYYTLDGTEPTTCSTRYKEPFFVDVLGDVTVKALAVLDGCFDGEATFSFTRLPYSLRECVAMEGVNVAVGGAAPWFRVTGEGAHDGKAALRSGAIGDGENSYVEMQVRGEVEVSFWWKISSQNKVRTDKHDYLAFSVDGEEALTLGGGVIDWTNATYAVTGSGRHSLRWTYIKDGADASNEDCAWLDDVVWSPTGKLCAVSFDANGGEVSECERRVREGSSVGDLPKPQRYCYDFDGWFTAADGGDAISSETEVADNVTYYALWKVSQYTVVFDENGGTGGMTVVQDYGTALSAPMVSRKGYTFTGWSPAVPATVPAGGATYTAQWKVNQYAVAFDANGGEGSITNQQDYASEIVPPEVSRTGYTFAGWLPEVEASVPASNVVYTAQWTANKYTVSFDANGGTGGWSHMIDYGKALSAPRVTRTGYTFDGWSPTVPATVPASNVTYTAQWKLNKYTVTFDANGGIGGKTVTQNYGTALSAPTVTRTGCTFDGWSPTVPATVPASNVTYMAQWKLNKYTVTFDANGGIGGKTVTQDYGTALSAPTVTRTGYAFDGWSPAVPATVLAGNVTYAAQWKVNQYTAIFDANGGTGGKTVTQDYGTVLAVPTVSREHYTFIAWSPLVPAKMPAGNVKYTAQWKKNAPTFTIKDGVLLGVELNDNTEVTIPDGVTRIGWKAFCGCSGLACVTIPNSVTNIYELAFCDCSGLTKVTIPDSVTSIGGSAFSGCSRLTSVTIPDSVTSIGEFAFYGCNGLADDDGFVIVKTVLYDYCGDDAIVIIPSGVTSIGRYAFGLSELAGVTIPNSVTNIGQEAFHGCGGLTSVSIPDSVMRIGNCAFSGCGRLRSVIIGNGVTHIEEGVFAGCSGLTDITIPDSVMRIDTYVFSNCESLRSVSLPGGLRGQIFESNFIGCPEDLVITYRSASSEVVVVIFNANGGSVVETSRSVTAGVAVGELPTPTRSGYTFVGWFIAASGGTQMTSATKVTANATYYAHWTKLPEPEPDPGPTPGPEPTPTPTPNPEPIWEQLFDGVDGPAPTAAASEYNGYLYDEKNGVVAGTIQVKVGKPGKKDGKASVKATVVVGTKKITLKGADKGKAEIAEDGPTTITLVGGEACEIVLGAEGLSGSYGSYLIDGARNFFASKDKGEMSAANDILAKWLGSFMVIWDGGSLSVNIAAKGKVKVSGTLADGKTKVSVSTVLLVGEEWSCVSVAAQKANLAFVLWLSHDGKTATVEGLGDGVLVGKAGTLADGAVFSVPADAALWSSIPGTLLTEYLPNGVPVTKKGTKWTLPKVGRITMKNGVIDVSKAGENPSGLKLTYKAKDGTFKGSFKVYAENKGRLKATNVNVTGFLLNGIGFGTATIKKVGSVSVRIEEK